MRFGAELAGGGTRFRLWAPACTRVRLELGREAPRLVDMAAEEDGWHMARLEGVAAGTAYAFRLEDGALVPHPPARPDPRDVHGPGAVVGPPALEWGDDARRRRAWHAGVGYERPVGPLSPHGTL